MIRVLYCNRLFVSAGLSLATYAVLALFAGFPEGGQSLALDDLYNQSRAAWWMLYWSWTVGLMALPGMYVYYPVLSRLTPPPEEPKAGRLPKWISPKKRKDLYVVLGEYHRPACEADRQKIMPSALPPTWFSIPAAGLVKGALVMGMTGEGKTKACLLPMADQLFGWKASEPLHRVGGVVIEVKGTLGSQVRKILESHGRGEDYIELGLESDYVYNPLAADMEVSERAFYLTKMYQAIVGPSKDPYWDEASQYLMACVDLTHRLLNGYVTLYDMFLVFSDMSKLKGMLEQVRGSLILDWCCIKKQDYLELSDGARDALKADGRVWDLTGGEMRSRMTESLKDILTAQSVKHRVESETPTPAHEHRKGQYEAAMRAWKRYEKQRDDIKAAVPEGWNNLLMFLDMNPEARRVFCPPKEAYDPIANANHKYGKPLPSLEELMETPAVICLSFPIAKNQKLGLVIGNLLKMNWHTAAIQRIVKFEDSGEQGRYLAEIIDEYHTVATAGKGGMGDPQFFNMSREALVIPIVAFQSINSLKSQVPSDADWKTIFQAFQTTISYRQKDVDTGKLMVELSGRSELATEHYGISEGGHDTKLSQVSGELYSPRSSVNMSHSVNISRQPVVEGKTVYELPVDVALVLANDGRRQHPPMLLYMHPYGTDHKRSWFDTHPEWKEAA